MKTYWGSGVISPRIVWARH